jgi:hypothetical protein
MHVAITEEARHRMYQRLEEVLGPEQAATLMEHLPPVGWADVATKRDIDELRVATNRDINELRVATNRDINELRVATNRDIDELGAATKGEFDGIRSDVKDLGNVLRLEFARGLNRQTLALMATNMTLVGLVLAAARFV